MKLGICLLELGFSRRTEYALSIDGPEGECYPQDVYIGRFATEQVRNNHKFITIEFAGSAERIVGDLYEILSSDKIRLQDYRTQKTEILEKIVNCAVMGLPDELIKEKILQTNFQDMTNAEILDFLSQKWGYTVSRFQLLNGQKLLTGLVKEGKILEVQKDREYRYSVAPEHNGE